MQIFLFVLEILLFEKLLVVLSHKLVKKQINTTPPGRGRGTDMKPQFLLARRQTAATMTMKGAQPIYKNFNLILNLSNLTTATEGVVMNVKSAYG